MGEEEMHGFIPSDGIPMFGGDRDISLTADNTVVVRYDTGEGVNDHCLVTLGDGEPAVFIPRPEVLEHLEIGGCQVQRFERPDSDTARVLAELHDGQIAADVAALPDESGGLGIAE